MPIYEYQCKRCHHNFEAMQKVSDTPITQCPKCFEDSVERLVSAAAFQLKGTGWYVTDFKDKAKPQAKIDATKSAETKAESAPAKPASSIGESD